MTSLLLTSTADISRFTAAGPSFRVSPDSGLTRAMIAAQACRAAGNTNVTVFSRLAKRLSTMETFDAEAMARTKEWTPGEKLTADHIESDAPLFVNIRDWKPGPKTFIHVPVITYRRGTRIQVITGPVEPTVPHTSEATHAGWVRWLDGSAAAKVAAIEAAKQRTAAMKAFFKRRDDDREAEYQARCDRAEEAGRPYPKRPKRRTIPADKLCFIKDQELVQMILQKDFAEQKKKRFRKFKHKSSLPFAGRVYAPYSDEYVREDGSTAPAVRSWLGPITFKLFRSALPKSDIHYGNDKTVEYSSVGHPHLFVLDSSHVVLDKTRRCAFIVDLDGWWPTLHALRKALRRLLPREFMPNAITYRGAEDGRGGVENPHLVWFLPPGSRVIKTATVKDRKNYAQQRKLHEMIQKAIVSHLIPLGADPGHTNVDKTKNMLAYGWSVEVCDDYFQTMDEWRTFLPTITPNLAEMKARAVMYRAAKDSEIEAEESMATWNDGKAFRTLEIAAARRRQDPAFLAAVSRQTNAAFVDWLYNDVAGVVVKRLLSIYGDTRAVRSVIRAQRQFVLELNMTPSKLAQWCERGRDRDDNRALLSDLGLETLSSTATKEERKARALLLKYWARKRTQERKESINRGLIQQEIISRLAAGIPVVKSEVVKALVKAGIVGRSTAYNHFDFVFEIVQRTGRYQGSDLLPSSCQSSIPVVGHHDDVAGQGSSDHQSRNSTVESIDPANHPPKSSLKLAEPVAPPWVVDKDSFVTWQEACRLSEQWAIDVAAWRSSKRRRQRDDGVDLANDPEFRAMVLQRSSWGQYRLH